MSNSNYSIRLKPFHTAYVLLMWPAQFGRKLVWGTGRKWPRPRWDRDVDSFSRDVTETRRWYVLRPRRRDRDHNPALYHIRTSSIHYFVRRPGHHWPSAISSRCK